MAEAADVPIVLVTGASGFIGTHIIKQLQTQGKYAVRGTVRSVKNEDKVRELKGIVPDATYPLELLEADLNKEDGWKEAVQGCTYVLHVASPFPFARPKTEDEVILPAVNGTLNVLKACAEVGTVKRVVLTSSCAAVGMADDSHTLTEEDWHPDEGSAPYTKSKIRAEKAAWDYVKGLEEGKKFELAVINPSFVMGPFLTSSSSGSFDFLKSILTKALPAIPELKMGFIDVRDVAAAHIAAMDAPEAAGNRHILAERTMWFAEVAEVISQEFTPQGYKIPSFKLPKAVAFLMKFVNTDMKEMYPQIGKNIQYSCERLKNVLKIQPRDPIPGIIESCYSLIEMGAVPKTQQYLGPPESRKQPSAANEEGEKTEEQPQPTPSNEEDKPLEEPKPEQEEPKREEPKQEEPKQEEPKQEEPKQEEPKQEEPKQEEPKQEEPKQEEPKQEEPKQEESVSQQESTEEEPSQQETTPTEQPQPTADEESRSEEQSPDEKTAPESSTQDED